MFENENLIKLIFEHFILSRRQDLGVIRNKSLFKIYLKLRKEFRVIHTINSNRGLSLAALPNGNLIAGTGSGQIMEYDARSHKCIKTIDGCGGSVTSLLALPGGFASGLETGDVRIHRQDQEHKVLSGHTSSIRCLVLLLNGHLVSGSADSSLYVWELNTYSRVRVLINHLSDITCAIELPNNILVSGSYDHTIRLWNINKNYNYIQGILAHGDWVVSLVHIKDGQFVSASYGCYKIWDKDFICIKYFEGREEWICSMIKIGNLLLSGASLVVDVWDIDKDYIRAATLDTHDTYLNGLVLLPGEGFASFSDVSCIQIWGI
jgi:WD40 repeat protein